MIKNIGKLTTVLNETLPFSRLANLANVVLTSLLLLLCVGCGGSDSSNSNNKENTPYTYQMPLSVDDWEVSHLDEVNIDEPLITDMMNHIYKYNKSWKIDSVAIVKNGKLVFDELIRHKLDYVDKDEGNKDINQHYMASVTKSVTSALLGIAIDKTPQLSIEDKMLSYFPEYNDIKYMDDRKSEVTIKNLLTMRHGFEFDEGATLRKIVKNSKDYVKGFLDQPMEHEPGNVFRYSSFASIALGDIVTKTTNIPVKDFAQTYLFTPLNIDIKLWLETPIGRTNTGYGLWLSTRDMAKFGQLFLQKGQWQGEQIISPYWVELSTKKQFDLPSEYPTDGYGFQWWTTDYDIADKTIETYFADGNGGQFIIVVPKLELVTIFTGSNYNDYGDNARQKDVLMKNYILPAILQ